MGDPGSPSAQVPAPAARSKPSLLERLLPFLLLLPVAIVVLHDASAIHSVYALPSAHREAKELLTTLSRDGCPAPLDGWVTSEEAARLCGFAPTGSTPRYEVIRGKLASGEGFIARTLPGGRLPDVWSVAPPSPLEHCRNSARNWSAAWLIGRDKWDEAQGPDCEAALALATRP